MWPITRRRRSNHDADIAREMADHLELEAAERRLPLPYHEPERLMMLDERLLPRFEHFEASPLDVLAWREKGRAFASIAAYVGYAVGLVAALAVTRVLSTLLYEIEPRDPVTLGAAAALLSATALAAAFVPAYRAARVDPMTALRAEEDPLSL